jgi:hypothetical protein
VKEEEGKKFLVINQNGRDNFADLGLDGMIILKKQLFRGVSVVILTGSN